jgi:hypothetical protein
MQQGTPIFHYLIKKIIKCLEKHNLLIFLRRERIVAKQILIKLKKWNLGCYNGALRRVVEEEVAHGLPRGEGGGAAMEHHVADHLGDDEVDPRDDAVVDLRLLDIEQTRVDGTVNMIHEAKFAKREFEQGTPRGVVGVMEFEDLGFMVFDVQ